MMRPSRRIRPRRTPSVGEGEEGGEEQEGEDGEGGVSNAGVLSKSFISFLRVYAFLGRIGGSALILLRLVMF